MWRGLGGWQTQGRGALGATRHRAMASRAQPLQGPHRSGPSRAEPQASGAVNSEGSTHALVEAESAGRLCGKSGAVGLGPENWGLRGCEKTGVCGHAGPGPPPRGAASTFLSWPAPISVSSGDTVTGRTQKAFDPPPGRSDTREPPRRLWTTVVSQLCPHQDTFHKGLTQETSCSRLPPPRPPSVLKVGTKSNWLEKCKELHLTASCY